MVRMMFPSFPDGKKCSIVNLRVVRVVNNEEPRMVRIGKPCFHLLKILCVCPTPFSRVNESLPRYSFAAGVDPEYAPETVQAASVSKT